MIAAIAAITLSDPYDYKFPYDRYDRYRVKKNAREDLEQTATYCILVYFHRNGRYNLWSGVVSI